MNYSKPACHLNPLPLTAALLLLFVTLHGARGVLAQAAPQRTPSDTVREFYKAMREKRFREAFAFSIYTPAIEGLTPAEFDELRPDFEKMAAVIPEKIDISGEQISGDNATVFMKIGTVDKPADPEPVALIRDGGAWIIGDRDSRQVVLRLGKQFFFETRIETHHNEVRAMLERISLAQMAYASQHNNNYSGLPALIAAGLVPKDIETPHTTGYIFHITLAKDGKSWTAGAEPASYGRSGRLSFYLDSSGLRNADLGGKPLVPTEEKNRNEFPRRETTLVADVRVLNALRIYARHLPLNCVESLL